MPLLTQISISYTGSTAERHALEFYDAAEALEGFQRSIALTAHLALNGEIITQAPALKGARTFLVPPEAGSWKATVIIASGLWTMGTAEKGTPAGHIIASLYDFAVHQTLGFHVDYEKTLGQQYEEYKKTHPEAPNLPQHKVDSLTEKLEAPVRQMHRPITASETADEAEVIAGLGLVKARPRILLDHNTADYVSFTSRSDFPFAFEGRVSSYNVNTYKGRLFTFSENRSIPFILAEGTRDPFSVGLITRSLDLNARSKMRGDGDVECRAFVDQSRAGIIKRLVIVEVARRGDLIGPRRTMLASP